MNILETLKSLLGLREYKLIIPVKVRNYEKTRY